jgi:hypothetical protein
MKALFNKAVGRLFIAFAIVALIALACLFGLDFYDPAPVNTPTQTSEPIGATHPKSERLGRDPAAEKGAR